MIKPLTPTNEQALWSQQRTLIWSHEKEDIKGHSVNIALGGPGTKPTQGQPWRSVSRKPFFSSPSRGLLWNTNYFLFLLGILQMFPSRTRTLGSHFNLLLTGFVTKAQQFVLCHPLSQKGLQGAWCGMWRVNWAISLDYTSGEAFPAHFLQPAKEDISHYILSTPFCLSISFQVIYSRRLGQRWKVWYGSSACLRLGDISFQGAWSAGVTAHECSCFSYWKKCSLAKLMHYITWETLSTRKKIKLFVIYWSSQLSSPECKNGQIFHCSTWATTAL